MAERPVSALDYDPNSWRLAPPHDKRAQGFVVSGFSDQLAARALFLGLPQDADAPLGGAWLKALREVAPVTDSDGKDPRSVAFAFTYGGLRKTGVDDSVLAGFDRPFKEGMFQEDRLRRLGDKRDGQWQETVIAGGPQWSGNVHMKTAAREPARAYSVAPQQAPAGQAPTPTPTTVDALLLLYGADNAQVDAWVDQVKAALAPFDVVVVRELGLRLNRDARGMGHEHFGFSDGMSQPLPFEAGAVKLKTNRDAPATDSLHRVPLGEFLLGHVNGHGEIAQGPAAPAALGSGLPPSQRAQGFVDLGMDGSYLVVRELKQNVRAFWDSMKAAADKLNAAGGAVDADWVASRVVGRNRDGHMLGPGGPLAPVAGVPDNEFLYFDRDGRGLGCPLGSHVRRANPRDGLAPGAASKETLLAAANNHRILRRGRKFGPDLERDAPDDGGDRGLLFMCLNTDISRQFEFVQQTWALNPNFARLYDEKDPLIGPRSPFTIPDEKLRRVVDVETFVQMAGGEYFFLPSLPALAYLAAL